VVADRLPDSADHILPPQPHCLHVGEQALESTMDKGGMDVLGLYVGQKAGEFVRVQEDGFNPDLAPDPRPGPD
jgi:hypothetical protein